MLCLLKEPRLGPSAVSCSGKLKETPGCQRIIIGREEEGGRVKTWDDLSGVSIDLKESSG